MSQKKIILPMSNTLEILLDRRWKKDTYTIGVLSINGVRFCDTVEDKERGLSSDMPIETIRSAKVPGLTAIPTGRYRVDMHTVSPKFKDKSWAKPYGGIVPRLVAVPCWIGVLIHPLNYASESEGCIGPGENKVKGGVIKSVEYFHRLMKEYLIPADRARKEIYITVR